MLQRAMAVDVILADVEQNADRGIERGRKVDLVGRHLDDVHAARARRLQRQDRGADIAAHLGVVAGEPGQMRDQRRGSRLAVGAGDGDEGRIRRVTAALAAEQLDVADHFDGVLARHQHAPVRRRMSQRRAGREDQRGEVCPGDSAQIGGDETGLGCLRDVVGIVIGGDNFGAACLQCVTACEPRTTEAEHRDRLACKGGDGDHEPLSAVSVWKGRRAPASPR
jgi:hypothetical protein